MKPNSFDNLHELVESVKETVAVFDLYNAGRDPRHLDSPLEMSILRLKAAVAEYEVKA